MQKARFRLPALDTGWATNISPMLLEQDKGYSDLLQNLDVSTPGVPKKRAGVVEVLDAATTNSIVHAKEYTNLETGTSYIIAFDGGTWFRRGTTTWISFRSGSPNIWTHRTSGGATGSYSMGIEGNMVDIPWGTGSAGIQEALETVFGVGMVVVDGLIIRTITFDVSLGTVPLIFDDSGVTKGTDYVHTLEETQAAEADMLTFANQLVLVDGVSDSALWDGAAVTTPAQFPVARYLAEYRNRIVAAGDPDEPSLLYLCHTGDPTIWNPDQIGSNATRMYVSPDDGEGITGILNMGTGGVLIGKPSALYGLFGYARANMAVDLLDSTVGSLSHKAMQYIMPYAYFVNKQGIYRYTGSGGDAPERISSWVQDYFESNTDMDELHRAVAVVMGRYYVITLPQVGGGYYTLSFHTETGRWNLWTAPVMGAYLYTKNDPEGIVYYSEPWGNQFYRVTPSALSDEGPVAINALIETRELDGDVPEVDKDFHDLYLICSGATNDYTVTVFMQVDNGAWENMGAVTVGTPVRMQSVHRIVLGRTARFLKFRFQNNVVNEQFSPLGLRLTYTPKDVL